MWPPTQKVPTYTTEKVENKVSNTKFCINCKWYIPVKWWKYDNEGRCKHSSSTTYNPVTGKPHYGSCSTSRTSCWSTSCGPEGKYFEEAEF